MQQGIIAALVKRQVTDNGSDAKLIGADHKPYGNSHKPTESSLAGKTGFKVA